MQPVILSTAEAGDGLAAVVVSVAPGRRITLVVPKVLLSEDDHGDTIRALSQLIERKGAT